MTRPRVPALRITAAVASSHCRAADGTVAESHPADHGSDGPPRITGRPVMRRLWPAVRVTAAVAILVGLAARFGAGSVLDGLRAVSPTAALLALGIGVVTTAACAGRWRVVARLLGLPLPLGTAVGDYYGALLLNAVLPAGVLGDVHRAIDHGRRSGAVGRGVRAVVVERCAGQVVLCVLAVALLAWQPALVSALAGQISGVGAAVALVVACGLGVVWTVLRKRVHGSLRAMRDDLEAVLLSPRVLGPVVLLSAVAVAGHIAMFLVAAGAAGVSAPSAELVPLAAAALLVMAVPLNVGGWGPREAFLAAAFGAVGLGAAHGLTVAVVYGALSLVACLPGVIVLLVRNLPQRGAVVAEPRSWSTRSKSSALDKGKRPR
ncbi:lysylphosphatidylglycerol synthase transmembrane domain-containing protein [Actinokineospora sp. 24-640]